MATLKVVARTTGDPAALAGTVRRVAADVSPDVPVSFTTMDETISNTVESPRFLALLFGAFAGLAVCLAMAGVYGVMAYAVEQRSKEIGLRIALGASRESVMRLILREGVLLTALGLALGLLAAAATTRVLATVLFDVRPLDIQVYAAVTALLAMVTLLAGALPARRAVTTGLAQVLEAE